MTTRVITLARKRNVNVIVRVNNAFLIEKMIILKAMISHSKGSYDKPNLTLVVISYEMTTRVRSSIFRH